jgi:hypothetical protein
LTNVAVEEYDLDNAPEAQYESLVRITGSFRVETQAQADAINQRVGERYGKMTAKNGETPCWVITAISEDAEFEDGMPLDMTEIHFLNDYRGKPVAQGSTPVNLAQEYLKHGVSLSYSKVGTPESVVGRTVVVTDYYRPRKNKPRPEYSDSRFWPVEVKEAGFMFTGEKRTVTRATTGDDTEIPAVTSASPDVIVPAFQKALVGMPVDELFGLVLGSPELKATGFVFGVPLLNAASDGSLVAVLTKNNVIGVEDGLFTMP